MQCCRDSTVLMYLKSKTKPPRRNFPRTHNTAVTLGNPKNELQRFCRSLPSRMRCDRRHVQVSQWYEQAEINSLTVIVKCVVRERVHSDMCHDATVFKRSATLRVQGSVFFFKKSFFFFFDFNCCTISWRPLFKFFCDAFFVRKKKQCVVSVAACASSPVKEELQMLGVCSDVKSCTSAALRRFSPIMDVLQQSGWSGLWWDSCTCIVMIRASWHTFQIVGGF